jgi:capsular exopolysaccharide synthesis family protein
LSVRVVDKGVLTVEREPLARPGPSHGAALLVAERVRSRDRIDLRSFATILHRNTRLVLTAVVVSLIVAVIVTLMTAKLYRAGVTLQFNALTYLNLNASNGGEAVADRKDFIATQVGLLKSRSLAQGVARDLDLAADPSIARPTDDPETRLRQATAMIARGLSIVDQPSAQAPQDGQMIRYFFVAGSPELAARIANAIADGFINASRQRRYDASAYASSFLRRQVDRTRLELDASERELLAYAQAQGIVGTTAGGERSSPPDSAVLQSGSLKALNGALAEATVRRILAEGAYRQQSAGGSFEVAQSTAGLRSTRAALEAQVQSKLTSLKSDHPEIVALRARIGEINRQIALEQSRAARGRSASQLAEYRAAMSAESALRAQVDQMRRSVLDLRGRNVRYTFLQREVDTNRSLYEALLRRYKQVEVVARLATSPVSVVDRAEVPASAFRPNLLFNLLFALVIGLAAGTAAALAAEMFHDTIDTRDEVRSKLGLACLGVIPTPAGGETIIDQLNVPTSAASEAYSAVLAALKLSGDSGAPKALLLTSTTAGEGKSSSALALARNYARRGERVLLIDADLRRPAFKGTSPRQGLTRLLTSDAPIAGHIIATQFDQLSLLPCGTIPPNPADLLAGPRFAAILHEALDRFDRVIVDGPPILGLADAGLLASAVGSVAMIVEAGRTRAKEARNALARIEQIGANVVGAILTKAPVEQGSYGESAGDFAAIDEAPRELLLH